MSSEKTLNHKARARQGKKIRDGEKIGGGFIIGSRVGELDRIIFSRVPYEHETLDDAKVQAARLAKLNPDRRYIVLAIASEVTAD